MVAQRCEDAVATRSYLYFIICTPSRGSPTIPFPLNDGYERVNFEASRVRIPRRGNAYAGDRFESVRVAQ